MCWTSVTEGVYQSYRSKEGRLALRNEVVETLRAGRMNEVVETLRAGRMNEAVDTLRAAKPPITSCNCSESELT